MFHTPSLHYKQHVSISFAQTLVCEIVQFNKMWELQRVVAFERAVTD